MHGARHSHKYWQHSAGHLTDSLSTFIYTLHMSSRASNEGYPKGRQRNYHKGLAALKHYANHPARPL